VNQTHASPNLLLCEVCTRAGLREPDRWARRGRPGAAAPRAEPGLCSEPLAARSAAAGARPPHRRRHGRLSRWHAATCESVTRRALTLPYVYAQELAGNQIAELGEGVLAGLTAVRDLDLSGNALARLGDGLAAMLALATLALERNRLDALPASLGGCAALARLDVSHNQLRALPVRGARRPLPPRMHGLRFTGCTGVLVELLTPGVSGCSCFPWPEAAARACRAQASLAGLPKLQRLLCTNNRLAMIPTAFGHMRHLKEFNLRRAPPCPCGQRPVWCRWGRQTRPWGA